MPWTLDWWIMSCITINMKEIPAMTKTKQRKPGPLKQVTLIPGVPGRAEKPRNPKRLSFL